MNFDKPHENSRAIEHRASPTGTLAHLVGMPMLVVLAATSSFGFGAEQFSDYLGADDSLKQSVYEAGTVLGLVTGLYFGLKYAYGDKSKW
jgi:hypothetical protein